MKQVFLIKGENKTQAEDVLKKDDEISRGSISFKDPSTLDIEADGIFVVIDNSEEVVKKAEELLKDFGSVYDKADEVLSKIQEQEDQATQGFGNILG